MKKIIRKFIMVSSGIMLVVMFNIACHTHQVTTPKVPIDVMDTIAKQERLGKWYKCKTCNETGKCVSCKGTGKVSGNTCKKCSGTGDCPNCYGQGGWRSEE